MQKKGGGEMLTVANTYLANHVSEDEILEAAEMLNLGEAIADADRAKK